MSRAAWKEEGESAALLRNASKNLAYLMERAGVDAAHLSEAIGLGVATINNIKRGVGNPTLLTLMELARFLTSSSVISSKASWGGALEKAVPHGRCLWSSSLRWACFVMAWR